MKLLYTLFTLSLLLILTYPQTINKPIIGIIAIPSEFDEYPSASWSYFAASYVKYLETGGAQVVPVPYDLPQQNLTFLLDRLNGIFFTGGGTPLVNPDGSLTGIGQTFNFTVNYVLDQNKQGNYYPLWGTCMGFQAIASLLQQSFSILTPDCVGCHGVNKNNVFNQAYQSRLYSQLPADLVQSMENNNISVFVHNSMLHVNTFENSVPLNQYLTPTTFSYDETGQEYVSSYESPTLPIYGTQYHQEKNNFEYRATYPINHCPDCTRLQQYLAKFFVNETKKNNNTFPEQQQYLIENHNPVVLLDSSYNQIYFFPASNSTTEVENSYGFLEI